MLGSQLVLKSLLIDLQAMKDKVSLLLEDTCACMPWDIQATASSTTICGAGFVILSAPESSGCEYQWQLHDGNSWNSILGATSHEYTALLYNTGTFSYRVIGKKDKCLSVSNEVDVVVAPSDIPGVYVSANVTDICNGGYAEFIPELIDCTGDILYQWQISTNNLDWTNIAGETASTLTYGPLLTPDLDTTTYYFRLVAICGACGNISSAQAILVYPDPDLYIIVEDSTICSGGSAIMHSDFNYGVGSPFYQWMYWEGSDWTNIPGATGSDYTTDPLTTGLHTFGLRVTMTSGCEDVAQVVVTVVDIQEAVASTSTPTVATNGTIALHVDLSGGDIDVSGAFYIQWEILIGGIWYEMFGITGADASIDLTTFVDPVNDLPLGIGTYSIRAHTYGDAGCEAVSNSVIITIS